MVFTIHDLKVDQTVIPSEDRGIFVTNINIPQSELSNIDDILERSRQLILANYIHVGNIQYQVCATYQLRNTVTGDQRQWSGSFNPRGNQINTLSPFMTFNNNSFKTIVKDACSDDNIYAKLRFYNVTTNWVFDRITSVIIAVQSVVNLTHPVVLQRGLLATRHGRRTRTVQSFLLP
jgi:hypothetical protein